MSPRRNLHQSTMEPLRACILFSVFAFFAKASPVPDPAAALVHPAVAFPLHFANLDPMVPASLINPYYSNVGDQWKNLRVPEPLPEVIDPNDPVTRGIIQNFVNALTLSAQEIINRQQSLLDLLTCRTCQATSPWQNFLNAISRIPTLGWIARPSTEVGQRLTPAQYGVPDGTFIAASNANGVIAGVGGSIYNNEPVPEYTFVNNQVSNVKPSDNKPVKPSKPKPVKAEVMELPTAKPDYDDEEKDSSAESKPE